MTTFTGTTPITIGRKNIKIVALIIAMTGEKITVTAETFIRKEPAITKGVRPEAVIPTLTPIGI